MRSQKYQVNDARRFLAPTVNRYKLHLATVKAQGLDKLVKRTPELNSPKDATIEINGDSPKIIQQRPGDCRQNVNKTHHPTVLAFVNDVTGTCRTVLPPATALPCGLKGDMGQQVHKGNPQRATHSAGATYSNNSSSALWPKGEPVTLTDKSAPGFPIAFRSRDDCACSPERLDLDRHCLEECPQLGGLHRLRLLNLQHNMITNIQNLSHLRFLVFLDLYDNHLTEMTGIAALSSLRVLMLGKNRIETISCLHNLTKLDVLDLHGNQISQIKNVSHLSELRVLNLAGNCISGVENLEGLDSLTELNLRRNSISSVTEVDRLPCLQRLFLSCNSITSFDDLACLRESFSLSELTLDGNPVALETWYKQAALRCVLQLRQLDMKRITEEERRMASAQVRKEDEKKRDCHKQVAHKSPALMMSQPHTPSTGIKSQDSSGTSKAGGMSLSEGLNCRKERESHFEKRRLAIRNAAQQWAGLRSCLELPSQNGTKEEVSPEISPAHSPAQTNGLTQEPSPDEPRRVSPVSGPERPTGGGENRLRAASRPNSPRDPRLFEAGGSSVQSLSLSDCHLAELDGDTLRLFGSGALEALERGWGVQTAGAVTVITFRYIHFDSIVPTLPRIRVKFPNLSHLIFLETSISRLPQLAALAQLRRLDQLTIHPECNPVVSLVLWRAFVLYRLHHFNLQKVNGKEVTMEEVIGAERLFGTLGHIAATETPSCRLLVQLEESRKRQLQFLLEGRGRRAGLSPEELRDNSRLLGEGLNRALFNYSSRDCSAESPEDSAVETLERGAMTEQYLQELVQRASDTNLKGESLHKLWPCMFVEMVRDCVLEMRDQSAFRRACLSRLSQTK